MIKIKRIVNILMVVLLISICISTAAIAQDTLQIKFAHDTVSPHLTAFFADRFAELVKEKSNGKIEVVVYGGGQLGSAEETVQQVQAGQLQISNLGSPIVRFAKDYGVLELPFLFRDRNHAFAVVNGPIGAELEKNLQEKGLKMLIMAENGWRQITNNIKPIYLPEDLKGLKIRTPNSKVRMVTFSTYGAAPTPMSFTELYSALQQGVVDGQENPLANIAGASLYEVQKYLSISNHIYSLLSILIGNDFWESLTDEQQGLLREAAQQAKDEQIEKGTQGDNDLIDVMKAEGMEVNYVDMEAFQEASKPIYADYPEWESLIERIVNTK